MFEVNNGNARATWKICSKLILKTYEHVIRVIIVNFEQILHIVLVFPLFTLNKSMPAANVSEF